MSESLPSMATAPLTPQPCESAPPTMPLPLVWDHRECWESSWVWKRFEKGLKVGKDVETQETQDFLQDEEDWNMLKELNTKVPSLKLT